MLVGAARRRHADQHRDTEPEQYRGEQGFQHNNLLCLLTKRAPPPAGSAALLEPLPALRRNR